MRFAQIVRPASLAALSVVASLTLSSCAPAVPEGDGSLLVDVVVSNSLSESVAAEVEALAAEQGITVEVRTVTEVTPQETVDGVSAIEADVVIADNLALLDQLAGAGVLVDSTRMPELYPAEAAGAMTTRWSAIVDDADGLSFAVPVAMAPLSVTFYNPRAFAEHGYQVPDSAEGFSQLMSTMKTDNSGFPLCAGMENDVSTGMPFVDWLSEFVLAQSGPEKYAAWLTGELASDSPEVTRAADAAKALLADNSVANGDASQLLKDGFANTVPMFDLSGVYGKQCFFVRQGLDFAQYFPDAVRSEMADGNYAQLSAFPYLGVSGAEATVPMVDAVFASVAHLDTDSVALLTALANTNGAGISANVQGWIGAAPTTGDDTREDPFVQISHSVLDGAESIALSPRVALSHDRLNALRDAAVAFLSGDVEWGDAAANVE